MAEYKEESFLVEELYCRHSSAMREKLVMWENHAHDSTTYFYVNFIFNFSLSLM